LSLTRGTNKIVKPADAAAEYWATIDDVDAHKPTLRRHESACKTLKAHMVATGKRTYEGITLVEVNGGKRLDQSAAIAELGDRLARFMLDSVRRSLVPGRRPKKYSSEAAA
jgi:hypothetical protein